MMEKVKEKVRNSTLTFQITGESGDRRNLNRGSPTT
jgi:hypothetical protein